VRAISWFIPLSVMVEDLRRSCNRYYGQTIGQSVRPQTYRRNKIGAQDNYMYVSLMAQELTHFGVHQDSRETFIGSSLVHTQVIFRPAV
jgi:hypothetical protein